MAIDRRSRAGFLTAAMLLLIGCGTKGTQAPRPEPAFDGQVLYRETFGDPVQWPDTRGTACAYERVESGLFVRNVAPRGSCELVLSTPVFEGPVRIYLRARRAGGAFDGDFGLLFGLQEQEGRRFYAYTIRADGAYALAHYSDRWRLLPGWQSSVRLHLGNRANTISVVLDGERITYFANDERLGTLAEASPAGGIGLFVGEPGLEVIFEEVRAERAFLPSGEPMPPGGGLLPETPRLH